MSVQRVDLVDTPPDHQMGRAFLRSRYGTVTGTGSFSIPLPLSPGRAGFGPAQAVTYDSGAGNGPFGAGWQLSIPRITRKINAIRAEGVAAGHDPRESV
ncbi:hypothetical protein BE21_08315 [Sorangium cellulosum]|uniref:Uncharacterized protein n=1 Tax=Sorangium cellulosum TaxID=56 RepID=A0A150U2M4_SORCE|nr:hypothetical protein BE21_08315 [Sorangium cellulosum]